MQTDELLDNLFLPPTVDTETTGMKTNYAPGQEKNDDIVRTLRTIQHHINALLGRLNSGSGDDSTSPVYAQTTALFSSEEKILEGTFTGEKMLGSDNIEYNVPPNYASKSKLVAGDTMKLTITRSGAFIYKQIRQVERRRIVGTLEFNAETKKWIVTAEGLPYRVLTASISFYRGQPGDEVVLLVPAGQVSEWATVDNVVHV